MANGKPGPPLGSKNAANRIPPRLMTTQLHKALKQYERVSEDDPKKTVKRGEAVRKIMDVMVEKAIEGNMDAINFITERIEGKAKQVTETSGQIDHRHSGLQISFESPREFIDVTPRIENGNKVSD